MISTKVQANSTDKYYIKGDVMLIKVKRISAKQIEALEAKGFIVVIVGG